MAFDCEMRAGHFFVMGNGKLGAVRCAADDEGLAHANSYDLAGERTGFYLESDAHRRIISSDPDSLPAGTAPAPNQDRVHRQHGWP